MAKKSETGGTDASVAVAWRAMAWAMGCSAASSTAAARVRTSSGASPALTATSTTSITPVVNVPVLSKTTVSIARVCSKICGPEITMPNFAPRPVPTSRAVGVAKPSAHGHATINTATAAVKAPLRSPAIPHHAAKVTMAMTKMIGTKIAETRSASR